MVSKISTPKNKAKQSTPLGPKHTPTKVQTQFHANPEAKHQAIKARVEKKGISFPHFQYKTTQQKPTPPTEMQDSFTPSKVQAQATLAKDGAGSTTTQTKAQDSFSPSKVKNKDLNASRPEFVNKAQEVAYVEELNIRANELGVAHILDEAMNKAGDKLHAHFSTKIPSQESLERTAEAKALLDEKNIGYTTHTLARVLQDGQAITLMKALKEFCENRADSSTFLAYDHRFDPRRKKFYNQFNFFRLNSATKQAVQIPLSPPNPRRAHQPKKLKARTVISNDAQKLNRRLQSGNFEILHTDSGQPITTNALYQQAQFPQTLADTSKSLVDQFNSMEI